MKRLNPATQKPFCHGETREDGYHFYKYTSILKLDGTFKEIWLHPETMKKTRADVKKRQEKNYVRKTSRLPKGWALKLRDPAKIARCKFLWQQMFNADPADKEFFDCEWVQDNGVWDSVRDLLMPYASDYRGH